MVEKTVFNPEDSGSSGHHCEDEGGKKTFFLILKLGRFHFLLGGFLLYNMGYFFAAGGRGFELGRYLLGYSILFTAQLSVSYSNDYFDRDVDVFNEQTPVSGGSGVLVANPHLMPLSRKIALSLIVSSLVLAFVYLQVFSGGVWLFVFVLLGNAMGWYYSAPPLRLAYNGWGEIANVAAMGLFFPGWGYYCAIERMELSFIILAMPLTLYGIFFIISVEMPDMEADRRGNKWTFVAMKGRHKGTQLIASSCILATLVLAMFILIIPTGMFGTWVADFLAVLAFFSVIPLISSTRGILQIPLDHVSASKYATSNIGALILFGFAANAAMLYQLYM